MAFLFYSFFRHINWLESECLHNAFLHLQYDLISDEIMDGFSVQMLVDIPVFSAKKITTCYTLL